MFINHCVSVVIFITNLTTSKHKVEKQHVSGTRRELFLLSSRGGRSPVIWWVEKISQLRKRCRVVHPATPKQNKKEEKRNFYALAIKYFIKMLFQQETLQAVAEPTASLDGRQGNWLLEWVIIFREIYHLTNVQSQLNGWGTCYDAMS